MRLSALRRVMKGVRGSMKVARKSARTLRKPKPRKDWFLAGRNYARKELRIPG